MKRTLLAIGACLAVTMIYLSVIVSLGLWKGKIGPAGGVIGTALLWLMLYYVWRYVRHGRPANTKPKVDEEGNWIFVLALLLFFGYGFTQLYAGYLGMEKLAGAWWAAGVVVAAVFFRFGLPLSIGAFYGAISIWGWPWWIAFPFVAPGLALNLLMVPGKMARLFNDWKKVDEDTFANPVEGVKPGASASNSASSPSLLKAYERLTEERNQGFTHEALWLKCLSEADGDEERAGHAYNRERAAMLMAEPETTTTPEQQISQAGAMNSAASGASQIQPPTGPHSLRPVGIIAGVLTLYFAVLYATRDDRADPRDVLTVLGPQTPVSVVAKPSQAAPPPISVARIDSPADEKLAAPLSSPNPPPVDVTPAPPPKPTPTPPVSEVLAAPRKTGNLQISDGDYWGLYQQARQDESRHAFESAVKNYSILARAGYPEGLLGLGLAHLRGAGLPFNKARGNALVFRAAYAGCARAQLEVAKILKDQPREQKNALKWAILASKALPEAEELAHTIRIGMLTNQEAAEADGLVSSWRAWPIDVNDPFKDIPQ